MATAAIVDSTSFKFTVIRSLTSSASTNTPSVSSHPTLSPSLALGPIVGGLSAALALLLFIFLLLKCRSSQRKIHRLQSEIDLPTYMKNGSPYGFTNDKERLDSYDSVNDGPKSALSPPTLTSPPTGTSCFTSEIQAVALSFSRLIALSLSPPQALTSPL
ncbi:hypothetical protein BYT27DRAFT_7187219 [Phlegmacium glaucopus]|nr:hypothetical protein BYT27DRAFT_7187219 [Phlegmacium glaucopus]